MTKKREIFLVSVGIVVVAVIILFIWAIQNKKITPFAGSVHSASLSLSPAVGDLSLNQEFTTDILLDARDLQGSGVELSINYDPEIIRIIDQDSETEGVQIATTNLFPVYFENIVDTDNGTIRLSAAKESDGKPIFINAPRVLASIDFVPIKPEVQVDLNFDFERGKTNDCNVFQYSAGVEQDVLFGINDGYYNVTD